MLRVKFRQGRLRLLVGGDDGFDGEKRDSLMPYRIRNQEILLLGEYLTFSLNRGNLERGLKKKTDVEMRSHASGLFSFFRAGTENQTRKKKYAIFSSGPYLVSRTGAVG